MATGMAIAGVLGAVVGGYSAYETHKQEKKVERENKKRIAEEKAQALEERKELINQQREQLLPGGASSLSSASIAGSSVQSLVGKLKSEILG